MDDAATAGSDFTVYGKATFFYYLTVNIQTVTRTRLIRSRQ